MAVLSELPVTTILKGLQAAMQMMGPLWPLKCVTSPLYDSPYRMQYTVKSQSINTYRYILRTIILILRLNLQGQARLGLKYPNLLYIIFEASNTYLCCVTNRPERNHTPCASRHNHLTISDTFRASDLRGESSMQLATPLKYQPSGAAIPC